MIRLESSPERQPNRQLVRLPTESERKLIQELKWKAIWFVILDDPHPFFDRLRLIARLMRELSQQSGFVLTWDGWMVKPERVNQFETPGLN